MVELGRLLTAMVTPFREDLSLDLEAAGQLARHLVETGSDGIVVCGTTGESPTLTTEEKVTLFRHVKETVGTSAAVVAGTGNYCTQESIELTRLAERAGVDGVMAVVPYYNNPPQEGLYRHFKAIAEATSLPVILYNVPPRSPRNLEASTVVRLAEIPNIVAVKEASKNLEQVAEIVAQTPESFRVYSGDDAITLPMMAIGAVGIISVCSHIVGRPIKEMIETFVRGDVQSAARMHCRLLPVFQACFVTTNPIPIKAAVNMIGLRAGSLRPPLVEATEKEKETLRKAMTEYGLLA
jgi:4-hydroxy-tetrahydrodipicolinate synthase